MAHIQAFVVRTLLIWVAVSVSGTTTELSKMAGDTVNIPCHFGNGTVENIFWYFKYCTEGHKILFHVKEKITFGAEYANRTSLQKDNPTLILRNITVADEGTYCCIVDRQGQRPVQNINTDLNVFSLRPDTLPKITPCSRVDESSSCIVHRNQSFTLTCTLPNVYPVEDTELIWYQDGKSVLSTDNITQNDDGTTDISRQIKILETGNFTCNTTYISANGRENTAVSVEARIIIIPAIIPPTDVPNTPDKHLTDGPIIWIALSVATVLIVGILLCICCLKKRSQWCFKKDNKKREEITQETELNQVEGSILLPSSTVTHGESFNRMDRIVTDGELNNLAGCLPTDYYTRVAIALGVSYAEYSNIKTQKAGSLRDANFEMLMNWRRKKEGGKVIDLDKALNKAECGGLSYKDM